MALGFRAACLDYLEAQGSSKCIREHAGFLVGTKLQVQVGYHP